MLYFRIWASDIKSRVHKVHILLVLLFPQQLHRLAEPLEMDDFPFPEEADHVVDVGIIAEAEDVVIGYTSFLLCRSNIKDTEIYKKIYKKAYFPTHRDVIVAVLFVK